MKIVDERTKKSVLGLMPSGKTFMYEGRLYMKADETGWALRLEDGFHTHFASTAELESVNTQITIHD